ncbi:SNF5-domain-containing protein [Dentipellis sp. KUC8613]|nr:SNF5-domain-containing protein [Dentipellis sp. KUC8613]
MSDSQLSQTISQLSTAASQYTAPGYAAPTPQRGLTSPSPPRPPASDAPANARTRTAYQKNIHNWSTSSTPPPRASSRRAKPARSSQLAPTTPAPPARTSTPTAHHAGQLNPPPATLPTVKQAPVATYASRLRTGSTLLMQPLFTHPPAHAHAHAHTHTPAHLHAHAPAPGTGRARRGAVVSYAEPASGDDEDDDIPDAGEVDSDGSDFVASGGTRTAVRAARGPARGTPARGQAHAPAQGTGELDQSYLGLVPPERFITKKAVTPTRHEMYSQEAHEAQAARPTALVPIRVEFETETHRVRDCFVWNVHEALVSPEQFARTFCADLELPAVPWAETVAAQIRAQLEDAEAVGAMDLGVDGATPVPEDDDLDADERMPVDEVPECRVVLSIDVQIDNHHLTDHIEWDLRSTLTPEAFTHQLCLDLGLSGEAAPLIAHAVHEELLKHKKDAIEWGVVGGGAHEDGGRDKERDRDKDRDKSGLSLLKDKTGLGLGWGRAPKDGRGPRVLRSVWRDWQEAEEFGTRWEVLTAEEVERREGERERASRRLRRETSKFQSSARTRRR